jgi:peptidoglycan/xylan/chitin deacetylase (PgdA/CDA1 family)
LNYLAELSDFTINLAFHDVSDVEDGSSSYTVTLKQLTDLADALVAVGLNTHTRLYFDDNYISFKTRAFPTLRQRGFLELVLAVPAASVGSPGFCNFEDLLELRSHGVRIAAHGYSHVRLASYRDGEPLASPDDGLYRDRQSDLPRPLCSNEILFQLVESLEMLQDLAPEEFVLPYGCFNERVVAINDRHGLYKFLGTSDFDLDRGQSLRPRLIVTNDLSASALLQVLSDRVGLDP